MSTTAVVADARTTSVTEAVRGTTGSATGRQPVAGVHDHKGFWHIRDGPVLYVLKLNAVPQPKDAHTLAGRTAA